VAFNANHTHVNDKQISREK